MAYDKIVDSAVLDAGLKQIADAIREKSGASDNLVFPAAMAEAIAAIEAGGGNKVTFSEITYAETNDTAYLEVEEHSKVILAGFICLDYNGTTYDSSSAYPVGKGPLFAVTGYSKETKTSFNLLVRLTSTATTAATRVHFENDAAGFRSSRWGSSYSGPYRAQTNIVLWYGGSLSYKIQAGTTILAFAITGD